MRKPTVAELAALLGIAVMLVLLGAFLSSCGGVTLPKPPIDLTCKQWLAVINNLPQGDARDAAFSAFNLEYPHGCPAEPPAEPPPTTTTTTTVPAEPPTTQPTAPPTAPPNCLPDQAGWVAAPDQSAVRLDAVRAALDTVRAEHPDWFTDGGARLANRSGAGVDALYDEMGRVAARSGLCAGQLRENGGRLDKFGIMQPGAAVEAYHLVEYGGFRIQNPIKVNSVWVPPAGGPPVTTPPEPPAEPPASQACPAPRPESFRNPATKQDCLFSWGLTVGRKWVDATLTVTRCCDFCKAIGMGEMGGQQRCTCPLRPEGNPERAVCEAEMGAVWAARGGQLVPNPDNPAQANCEGPGCQVRVCTTAGGPAAGACSEWKP